MRKWLFFSSFMKPGKEVGQTLHHFLELVLEEPEKNTKKYLLKSLED